MQCIIPFSFFGIPTEIIISSTLAAFTASTKPYSSSNGFNVFCPHPIIFCLRSSNFLLRSIPFNKVSEAALSPVPLNSLASNSKPKTKETKALATQQVLFEGVQDDILRAKTPGYMRMLTMSNRFVVPVQAKLYAPERGE